MLKRIVALGVAVFGLSAAPALAQQYPPDEHKIDVSTMTPCPAEPFIVTAQKFAAGSAVTAQLASTGAVLGTATADAQGVATFEVSIPDSPAPGGSVQRDIEVAGHTADHQTLTLSAAIEIRDCDFEPAPPTVPAASSPSGGLPVTGSNSTKALVQIGLALAAAGGVLLALARRRRNASDFRTA